jgi:hypothetical protein
VGEFNYNIQGTHKLDLSLAHDERYLNLFVTFTGTDTKLLPQYDLVKLCHGAIHQAVQTYHELRYGFFGKSTAYSVVNNHQITIQPTQTAFQAATEKRSEFGAPIGIINIQIGDQAKNIELFNLNGLPGK